MKINNIAKPIIAIMILVVSFGMTRYCQNKFNSLFINIIEWRNKFHQKMNVYRNEGRKPIYEFGKKEIDLDGDGQVETIRATSENGIYKLYLNKKTIVEDKKEPTNYEIVDIDKRDNIKEIAYRILIENSDYVCGRKYFIYNHGSVAATDIVPGGYYYSIKYSGNGIVETMIDSKILVKHPITLKYYLNEKHLLVRFKAHLLPDDIYDLNYNVVLKTNLPARKLRQENSESVSYYEGENINIIATDNQDWILVRDSNGLEGWVRVEEFNIIKEINKNAAEVFQGLYNEDEYSDLNGDGKKDVVNIFKGKLYVNSIVVDTEYGEWAKIVDIDKNDKIKEIMVSGDAFMDDYALQLYYYDGKSLNKMHDDLNYMDSPTIDGSGTIKVEQGVPILQYPMWCTNKYKIDEKHMLKKVPGYSECDRNLIVKQPLRLQKSPEDPNEAFVLEKGDRVVIVLTDNKQWFAVEDNKKRRGWFAIEGKYSVASSGESLMDVFDGFYVGE